MNVEKLIRTIEESKAGTLKDFNYDYPSDKSSVTLSSETLGREITILDNEIKIHFRAKEEIPSMLKSLKELANDLVLISPNYKLLE